MYQAINTKFPKFQEFPAEIRSMIWTEACLEEKEDKDPGVCVFTRPEPPKASVRAMDPSLPYVDISVPLLMAVCAESRAVVLGLDPDIRFRYSADAGCDIACRELDPEIDTVYLSHANFDTLMAQANVFGGQEANIKHVAIDACLIVGPDDRRLFNQVIPKFPSMHEIKVVLKSETLSVRAQSPFPLPTTPFRLVVAHPSGPPPRSLEIHRWLCHLRQKDMQLNRPRPPLQWAPPVAINPAAVLSQGPPFPVLHPPAPAAPVRTHKFRPYVFVVPGESAGLVRMWDMYPRAKSGKH